MLPIIHINGYQNFLTILIELEVQLRPSISQALPNPVKTSWQYAYQYFQTNLENCLDPEIEPEIYQRWLSVQTEIRREVRLLNTDLLFWQSSRQSQKQLGRQTSCWQRSQKLINYCQMLLDL